MGGKIQNADHKSLAELQALGADKPQLLNTDKIYTSKSDDQLENVLRKNNDSAVIDPDELADSNAGYEVGSRWINSSTKKAFTCVDATAGAAIWSKGGSGGSGKLNFIGIGDQEDATLDNYTTGKSVNFGDSGTLSGTLSLDNTSPLRGDISLKYENAAVAGDSDNDWFYRRSVVPAGYQRESLLDFSLQFRNSYTQGNVRVKAIDSLGNTLVNEVLNQYVIGTNSEEYKRRVLLKDGVTHIDWGIQVVNGETGGSIKIDDVLLTPEIGFVEQNIIEVEDDVTETKILSSHFTSAGDIAELQFDGLEIGREYVVSGQVHGFDNSVGAVRMDFRSEAAGAGITYYLSRVELNTGNLYSSVGVSFRFTAVSETMYCRSVVNTGGQIWGNGNREQTFIQLHKKGKITQIPTTSNQKVLIPTSELRLESSGGSRGTGSESRTILMDTPTIVNGDAISYDNSNGTIVTILKDGLVSVSSSMKFSGAMDWYLSLNQADGSVVPTIEERLTRVTTANSNYHDELNTTFVAKAGDKLRLNAGSAPNSGADSSFRIVHQEQEISVNINSVKPQYEDEDSMVRLIGGDGFGSTNTSVRRFLSVVKNLGSAVEYVPSATEGDHFLIKERGLFHISYVEDSSSGVLNGGVSVNSTQLSADPTAISKIDMVVFIRPDSASSDWSSGSNSVVLEVGDIVRVQCSSNVTNTWTQFTISKQANPSVVGIDGNPTVVFKENSTIRKSYRLTETTSSNMANLSGHVQWNTSSPSILENGESNNSIFVVDHSTDPTTVTMRKSAMVDIGYVQPVLSPNIRAAIFINDVQSKQGTSGYTGSVGAGVSLSTMLNEGDVVKFALVNSSDAIVDSYGATEWSDMSISATAAQDSIQYNVPVTDAQVEIPTSEIRMEGANSRGASLNTQVVKFNNTDFMNGDAFSTDSTDGTFITILKDGVVTISVSLETPTAADIGIWKNPTVTNSGVSAADKKDQTVARTTTSSNWNETMSWRGTVKAGDVVCVASDHVPVDTSGNLFQIIHEENKTEIKISNVEPQWEDYDSEIRLHTGVGFGTTNTKIRRFSGITSKIGDAISYEDSVELGSSFTANKSGIYHMSYSEVSPQGGSTVIDYGISLNSTQLNTDYGTINIESRLGMTRATDSANDHTTFAVSVFLKKGDVVRPHGDGSGYNHSSVTFSIAYQGKPSIVGADLTAFVNVEKRTEQEISFYGSSDNGLESKSGILKLKTENLKRDGSSIIRIDQGSTETVFVATKDCSVDLSMNATLISGGSHLRLYKNGQKYFNGQYVHGNHWNSTLSSSMRLRKGETFSWEASVAVTDTTDFSMTIIATADAVETISETADTFDTDSADFTFSSTPLDGTEAIGTYNEYQYNASSNVSVIQGTSTQNSSDLNRSGFAMSARAYANGARTYAPRVDVQIGKGHKTVVVDGYADAAKTTPLELGRVQPVAANSYGTEHTYDPNTGILRISSGVATTSAETARFFGVNIATTSAPANGYVAIQASRKLPLVNMPTRKIAIIKDVKTNGVSGGTFTSGAWRTRDLNTLEGDSTFVSLSTNQFTLEAGEYKIRTFAPSKDVNNHKTRVYNFTDSAETTIISSSASANVTGGSYAPAIASGVIKITEPKTFELQHRCGTSRATDGFGAASGYGNNENYSDIEIEKLS